MSLSKKRFSVLIGALYAMQAVAALSVFFGVIGVIDAFYNNFECIRWACGISLIVMVILVLVVIFIAGGSRDMNEEKQDGQKLP